MIWQLDHEMNKNACLRTALQTARKERDRFKTERDKAKQREWEQRDLLASEKGCYEQREAELEAQHPEGRYGI